MGLYNIVTLLNRFFRKKEQTAFPLNLYFDPEIFAREQDMYFRNYGGFIGFSDLTPNKSDYCVIPHTKDAKVLVYNDNGPTVLTNICRHRQSTLLKGRGRLAQRIICPIHKWNYHHDGRLAAAPEFNPKPNVSLFVDKTYVHRGFISTDAKVNDAWASMKLTENIDFNDYKFVEAGSLPYAINWKEYIDVYMDNYHVNTFHAGLKSLVNIDSLEWEFGDNYITHTVGFNKKFYESAGTPPFQRYAKELMRFHGGKKDFDFGAIWIMIFPNIIIELYQHFAYTAVAIPETPTLIRAYFALYAKDGVENDPALYRAFADSMDETEYEDSIITEAVSAGRQQLYKAGLPDHGPYHHPTELGMKYFHAWVKKNLGIT